MSWKSQEDKLTYLDKLLKDKKFKNRFDKEYGKLCTYEELCEKLENGTDEEKNDIELKIMGKWYYEGD